VFVPTVVELENIALADNPAHNWSDEFSASSNSTVSTLSRTETSSQLQNFGRKTKSSWRTQTPALAMCAIAGAFLGLSAPGLDQGFIAWFGVAPLFAFIFSARSTKTACLRAFVFGACYNMVYLHWFLTLDPAWAWFSPKFTALTATFWWLFASFHQGTIFGVFAIIARKIPLKINSIRSDALPTLFALPLLWVLLFNKLGNHPIFVGIPWSMLEYSQYQNIELLQIAKYIGGIGIGATIVMCNTALFLVFVTLMRRTTTVVDGNGILKMAPYPSNRECIASVAVVTMLLAVIFTYGHNAVLNPAEAEEKPVVISILQGNLAGTIHGASSADVVTRYVKMSERAPLGICLWTEWVLPISLNENKAILDLLLTLSKSQNQDWLIGALEREGKKTYNVVCGLTSAGRAVEPTYRKRYLVPFGEFIPQWLADYGVQGLIATSSPNRCNLQPGTAANVIKLNRGSAGVAICLEVVSPELVNDSVRDGADIITDLSNTTWFHSPNVGQQLIAFSVMRAAETSRSVSFSTTTGPSAIIAPSGRILGRTKPHQEEVLSRSTSRRTDITPFVRWFR